VKNGCFVGGTSNSFSVWRFRFPRPTTEELLAEKTFLFGFADFPACPAMWGTAKAGSPAIDLPHPYYFREMYLPQLTSGRAASLGRRIRKKWRIRWRDRCGAKRWIRKSRSS